MADMTELGTSAEPKSGGEVLKARFKALVEANSLEVDHAEREMEIVRFGEFSLLPPAGPILFDGVRFSRQQFIDWRSGDDSFYFADTIAITFGTASIYEITYDAMSDEFNSVQTGPGSELFDSSDDTPPIRERTAQALVDWVESVELDLQFRGDPTFAI